MRYVGLDWVLGSAKFRVFVASSASLAVGVLVGYNFTFLFS